MTHLALAALLGLVCEYCNLLSLAVLDERSLYACAVNVGSTYYCAVVLANHDNLVDCELAFNIELFNEDLIAFFYLILFSACVKRFLPIFIIQSRYTNYLCVGLLIKR